MARFGTTWASLAWHDPAGHSLPRRGIDGHSLAQHSMAKPSMAPAWHGYAQRSLGWHGLARHSSAWHGFAQPSLAWLSVARFGSAQFGMLELGMAQPDPMLLGTGWDAPHCPPCLLMLPEPGEIFQLLYFHWFPFSPGLFSRRVVWLPGSWVRGEARADVLCRDRDVKPFCLWSHIDLTHTACCRVGTSTHQVPHPGGFQAFCTLCSSSGWSCG